MLNIVQFSAEDLRINRSWENWPSHLVLPMMLMRENMKQSMLMQSLGTPSTLDLSISPKSRPRLPQESPGGFVCGDCGRTYKLKSSLRNHQKWECGKEPQFKCPYCVYKAKQKMHMARHMERMHRVIDYSAVKTEIKSEINEEKEAREETVDKQMDMLNDNCSNSSNVDNVPSAV
ncbi:unnamed protein product [Phaedon cochleariae]|uniref:C2H2-type domain-containing protein n=1 Tax=Phaedon cochleariae TaxID=80249 RepID=A0A9P0DM49_PHACE|nr:unnamed protein product [Phaedon cochleariae]